VNETIDADTGEIAVIEKPVKAKAPKKPRVPRPQQAHHFTTESVEEVRRELVTARIFCDNAWAAGRRVAWTLEEEEDAIYHSNRKFFHGYVLGQISEQVRDLEGRKHPIDTWKLYYTEKFLGHKWNTYVNPYTGKKTRRKERISTEDIGNDKYKKFTEQVMADAATELNVVFEDYEVWKAMRAARSKR
jgi:hypothetical protein